MSRLTSDYEKQLVKCDCVREEKDRHGFQGDEAGKELIEADDAEDKEKMRSQEAEWDGEGVVLDELMINQWQVMEVEIGSRQSHIKGH